MAANKSKNSSDFIDRPVDELVSKKPVELVGEDKLSSSIDEIFDVTYSVLKFARKSIKAGSALLESQDKLNLIATAGQSLKDMRELSGLTIAEMSDALNLKDKSLLESVEEGTASLSFELILRLSALFARNDPVPFILKLSRSHNPELWNMLNDRAIARIPLHLERERQFLNIFRQHDSARSLSDEEFDKVMEYTQKAFELALYFAGGQSNRKDEGGGRV